MSNTTNSTNAQLISVLAAIRLARRLAVAISQGMVEAKQVASMSDEELASFDEIAFEALTAKQAEADRIAETGVAPGPAEPQADDLSEI